MKRRLAKWLQAALRRFYTSTHGKPPALFMRVAYYVPRQVALITTRHENADNVWPMDWHLPLSEKPKLYGLAVTSTSYGAELIRGSGVFVVNFVPHTWENIILHCGHVSGRVEDKFAATGLVKEQAVSVDAPRLAGALGVLECRVEQTHQVGDHTLFVGRVTYASGQQQAERLHHLDSELAPEAEHFEAHR